VTYKQKVLKLAAELGVEVEIHPWREYKIARIELHFPEGVEIDELTSLCHNWQDAYSRLQEYAPAIKGTAVPIIPQTDMITERVTTRTDI
jgi:hypothetical protein